MSRRAKPKASDAVRGEWLRRVEAEYRSSSITQHLTLWLTQVGASPDLVKAGLRIAADEIVHSDLSYRTYVAAGGTDAPRITRESLAFSRTDEPLERDVTRFGVEIFCLGETVAVPLFKELREPCTVPTARRALDRILRDEVRHRDFGWTLLSWLTEHPMWPELEALIVDELPGWFRKLKASYAPVGVESSAVPDEDRAWGLMPLDTYRACVDKAFERDWLPRFAKVGIDARRAF